MSVEHHRIQLSVLNKRQSVNIEFDPDVREALTLAESIAAAESRLLDRVQPEGYRAFGSLLERMQAPQSRDDAGAACIAALRLCQHLYGNARSLDALPFARANLALAESSGDAVLLRRAHTACGLLSADTADLAGAIEHHTRALRLAVGAGDVMETSRVWNNIGVAFMVSGNMSLAVECFRRVISIVESQDGPVYSRYSAFTNLAHCLYHLDKIEEGLEFAGKAMGEITPAFFQQDPHNALLLHRNCVRLYISAGRLQDAKSHVAEVLRMAGRAGTPRASIAGAVTQAAYEMACGDHDLGLSRLDQTLAMARAVPATLRDTLVTVVRAEEKAGFPAHALVRMHELSDHIYRTAVKQIRHHVELADLMPALNSGNDQAFEQAKVRLTAHLDLPAEPPQWKTLQRLAVSATFRFDNSGWHGVRVGALTQALALEYGLPPMQALEFGQAAQIHDIGMASVPERILLQSGPLNPTERMLVRKHTAAGVEILAGDQHPRILSAGDVIKYHHAYWNGEGYPDKVAGSAIPLAARMCAVADVYDTLVTDRPYRKACSMDKALVELRRVAGTQLDPELVRCFETVIRREAANEGIDPSKESGLENFQQLIAALTEDRGFI